MGGTIFLCVVLAIVLASVLLKFGSAAWYKYRCRKYNEEIDKMFAELKFMCEHNRDKAEELLFEWRMNDNTDARDIWSEEELVDRVYVSAGKLSKELEVFYKYKSCCEKYSSTRKIDMKMKCLAVYSKYLKNSINFRQNMSIIPITSDDISKEQNINDDNSECKNIIVKCERQLDLLL